MACICNRIEREVLLAHVQNLVLCFRSNQSFVPRPVRFSSPNTIAANASHDHPLLAQALRLQSRLLSLGAVGSGDAASDGTHGLPPRHDRPAVFCETDLTERDILDIFCQVCTSPDTTETMTNVALAGLTAIVELPCSFLSSEGLRAITAAASGAKSEVTDRSAHEVLLAKVADVFVVCARHPATATLPEEWMCRMMNFLLAISVDRQASALLRRVAEKCVHDLVQVVFERAVASLEQDEAKTTTTAAPPTASSSSISSSPPPFVSHAIQRGGMTLRLVSLLIAGDIVAFNGAGEALLADGRLALDSLCGDASGATRESPADVNETPAEHHEGDIQHGGGGGASPPAPLRLASPSPNTASPSRQPKEPATPKSILTVFERNVRGGHNGVADDVALQLVGLDMTQRALTVLANTLHHVDSTRAASLIHALQHHVSRALLIAGVSTTHVVVLSQIMRTVHMTVRCASQHLVPQVLGFLRVLHLNQLVALKEQIQAAESGLPVSSTRRAGGAGFHSSPSSPASTSSNGGFLSAAQVNDLQERRVVLLESLSEFCADPNLCHYCYINYDLSWQYAPVLRELCDVLVSNAPASVDATDSDGRKSKSAGGGTSNTNSPVAISASHAVTVEAGARLVCSLTGRRALTSPVNPGDGVAIDAALRHAQEQKQLLQQFTTAFDDAALKKAIPFLLTHHHSAERGREHEVMRDTQSWLVVAEPAGGREVGECLFRLSVMLNKRTLGDYIGELGRELRPSHDADEDSETTAATLAQSRPDDPEALIPGTVLFFHHQLLGYMQQFDFKGKSLLRSIREMVFQLCLPGESQKIDRIMEAFAHHWFVQNTNTEEEKALPDTVNPFHSENGAFVLSFAIIMLNTDLHSGKLARNMAASDFKAINRGIDDQRDVPEAYLLGIYEDVRQHEIIMADMIDRGFANDVTWELQMCGPSVLQNMSDAPSALTAMLHYAPCLATAPAPIPAAVAHALNEPILEVICQPCLRILGGSLDACGELLDLEAPIHDATVGGALNELRKLHRCEVDTFMSALHGLVALSQVVVDEGQGTIADQILTTLLPPIDVTPSGRPQENMEDLFLSLCRLLRIRVALGLLPTAGAVLHEAWSGIAKALLRLQYLGFFAWHPTEDAGTAKAFSASHGGAAVASGLSQNPGFVKTVQENRLEREEKQRQNSVAQQGGSGGRGGGWLSSLWNGGDRSEPDALERALVEAEPRVRECIPDIGRLLDMIAAIPPAGRHRLSAAIAESCEATVAGRDPVADLVTHSYALSLLCAVAEPYDVSGPAVVESAGGPLCGTALQDADPVRACEDSCAEYDGAVTFSRRLIASSLEMIEARRDPAFRSGVESLVRVTSAMMGCVQRRLLLCARLSAHQGCSCYPEGELTTDAGHPCGPVWRLFELLLPPALPLSEYAALVQPAVVGYVEQSYLAVLELYRVASSAGAKPDVLPVAWLHPSPVSPLPLFLPFVSALVFTTPCAVAQAVHLERLTNLAADVVRHRCYHVTTQTETLVVTLVSLRLLWQDRRACKPAGHTGTASADDAALWRVAPEGLYEAARHLVADGLVRASETTSAETGQAATLIDESSWLTLLKGLCALLACTETVRDAIDVILVLQRTLLNAETSTISPPHWLRRIYSEVLLPLVEHVCAHGSTLVARAPEVFSDGTVNSATGAARSNVFHRLMPDATKLWRAYDTRHRLVDEVFHLGQQVSTATAVVPSGRTLRLWEACAKSTEVKARLLNVLPKVLLQEAASLAVSSPDTLRELWRRVLGTLYAVYSSSPPAAAGASAETYQLLEAIEETVKNMVFVASSVLRTAALPAEFDLPGFWTLTQQLVTPFSFATPLVHLLASLVNGGEMGDALAAATITAPATPGPPNDGSPTAPNDLPVDDGAQAYTPHPTEPTDKGDETIMHV